MNTYEVWDEGTDKVELEAYSVEGAIWKWLNHDQQADAFMDLKHNGFTVTVRDVDRGFEEQCHVNVIESLEITKG